MMAGSGINAKPSEATEQSMAGLSLKVKSTASRAPPAWSSAETMARAVCGNSRSAVISGPRSDRASTVRSSRRKLFFCTATHRCGQRPEQKKSNMRRNSGIRSLLVSLVLRTQPSAFSCQLKTPVIPTGAKRSGGTLCSWQVSPSFSGRILAMRPQFGAPLHYQQLPWRFCRLYFLMLQHPRSPLRNEHGVQPRSQSRIDIRLRAVANHPGGVRKQFVLGNHRMVSGDILFRDNFNRSEIFFQTGAFDLAGLLRHGALGHQDQVMALRQILQRLRYAGQKFHRVACDGMGESIDGLVQGRG